MRQRKHLESQSLPCRRTERLCQKRAGAFNPGVSPPAVKTPKYFVIVFNLLLAKSPIFKLRCGA
jgi:hypothetical protein